MNLNNFQNAVCFFSIKILKLLKAFFFGSGCWNRTSYLWVMSPMSYHFSYPQVGEKGFEPLFQPDNGCVLSFRRFPYIFCLSRCLWSGGWIRTIDLKVMSLASYHCSTPQVGKKRFELLLSTSKRCLTYLVDFPMYPKLEVRFLFYRTPVYLVVFLHELLHGLIFIWYHTIFGFLFN